MKENGYDVNFVRRSSEISQFNNEVFEYFWINEIKFIKLFTMMEISINEKNIFLKSIINFENYVKQKNRRGET